jgi:hypothetical protein
MRVEFTVETRNGENGGERNYAYSCELSDKTTLETVEAHIANIARLLDRQASEALDDEDEEDDEGWKKAKG